MNQPAPLSPRQIWIRLLLYPSHTLPTAAAPVLVGIGLAVHDKVFAFLPMLVAFLASWVIHIGGVFTDNYELLRRHPHVPEHPELLQGLDIGTLTLPGLRWAIFACFGLAALTLPYMIRVGGSLAVAVGMIGAAASFCYAGGPLPYVKRGFADPLFFAMFGIVAVAGTYYIQAVAVSGSIPGWSDMLQALPANAFLVGLPVGALVTNVMVIDDIRDRQFDARKGWNTTAVRFGLLGSRVEYLGLTLLAYALPFWFWLSLGFSAWVLLPLVTLPLAVHVARAVCTRDETHELIMMTPRASYLSMLFSMLLAAGIAMPSG